MTDLEKKLRNETLRGSVGHRTYDTLFDKDGKYAPTHEANFVDVCDIVLDNYDKIRDDFKKAVDYFIR